MLSGVCSRGCWLRVLVVSLSALSSGPAWSADPPNHPTPPSSQPPAPASAKSSTAESAAAPNDAAPPSVEAMPEAKISFNLAAGLGGGSHGFAGRLGGDFHVWLTEAVGVGGGAALVVQTELFGDDLEFWSAGPSVAVRTPAPGAYWFGSLSVRFAEATLTDAVDDDCIIFCPAPLRSQFDAVGVTLRGGGVARIGPIEVGGAAALDLIFSDSLPGSDHVAQAFTVNFVLGFGT